MDELLDTLYLRQAHIPSEEEMPKVGFVAIEEDTLVAYCALRMVEGQSGMVDGLTTNPECSAKQRHAASDLVIKACINEAKELKLKSLIAYSLYEATVKRSIRNGFVELPHVCLAYDLNRKA